jgi:tetratricopeptide (TPR) repeat protein
MFMSGFIRFWLFCLICVILSSCTFMPDELKTAERLMETAPDSSLHILQHLSPEKYHSSSNRALYGLLMFRALDKKKLPLQPDSLLDYSIRYYESHSGKNRLAMCYLYKGRNYKNNNQYEKAISFYLKASDVIENHDDYLLLGRLNSDLGDIYILQQDYLQAREKYILEYKYFILANQKIFADYSILDIGKTYLFTKDYRKAQQYFHKVYTTTKDSLTLGAAIDEIGLCYYRNKQLDSALVYYRKVIHFPYIAVNKSIRYYYLANIYYDLSQIDSAYFYAKNAFNYEINIHTQRECYRILTNSEYKKGNMKSMAAYMSKYVVAGDSMRKIDGQTKATYIETMHNSTLEVDKTKNVMGYLALLIVFIVTGSIIVYYRMKKHTNVEKLLAEETNLKQKAGIRLEVMTKYRDAFLQKMETKKAEQASERKKASFAEKELLDRKIYNDLLHLQNIAVFYREMDTVLNNLVTKLRIRYPSLAEKEINWCCLYLLQVPTTDIYLLLDYKVDSLKKMRQRLAQKLGLAGVTELEDFLKILLSE